MTPPTERQTKSRAARRNAGLVPKTVWLPESCAAEILAMVDGWVKARQPIEAAPVVSTE